MRALALDYGATRTGVAVSDATGTLARPLGVVERAASEAGLESVARLVAEKRSVGDLVDELYLRALSRFPTPPERGHWEAALSPAGERRELAEDRLQGTPLGARERRAGPTQLGQRSDQRFIRVREEHGEELRIHERFRKSRNETLPPAVSAPATGGASADARIRPAWRRSARMCRCRRPAHCPTWTWAAPGGVRNRPIPLPSTLPWPGGLANPCSPCANSLPPRA